MKTHILLYHALDSASEPVELKNSADMSVVLRAGDFKAQLQYLSKSGKRVASLEDVLCPKLEDDEEDERVVLTFDDGHKSNYSLAFPLLLEAGMVATFYVVAGFVDRHPDYVTSAQLREMVTHNMLIGSHGMAHRWLSELNLTDVRRELADSKARLEDILQKPVLDFALPGGHFNRTTLRVLRDSDYRSVATSKAGVYRMGDDPLRLPRVEMRRGLSIGGFRKSFHRSKLLQWQLLEAGKSCLRNTCGLQRYTRLRHVAYRFLNINRS